MTLHHTRRQALRHKRRWKMGQGLWRLTLLMGLSGGLGWALSHPYWLIRDRSQIEIEGNHFVSDGKIEQMLAISYPKALWSFPSQGVQRQLQEKPPIATAHLKRSLFPPQITVDIQEREPVAVATMAGKKGFIDEKGVFIEASFYDLSPQNLKISLNVLDYQPRYAAVWQTLYPLLQQSPVKIQTVDWRHPNNLILQTALGKVYLGSNYRNFAEKLQVLSQITALSSKISPERLIYIDLSQPHQPTVQLKHEPEKKPLADIVKKP